VENCDNLVIQDLTLENSFGELKGQAEAIYFNSGSNQHRMTVENCSLISYQDTFQCKGVVWVHNSLIAGHCDFIWGSPKACLFEDCEIRSRAAGYIVQARVPSASDKGFVFLNCRLTAENGVKDGSMYLARSAGKADCFDNVVYVGCTMGPVINAGGWLENPKPNPASPTATSGWREYGSVTPSGSSASAGRNGSGLVLSAAEAEAYSSRQAVLGW
jgi:pectin methylesterase-like acyl-CoA thioesterase